MGSSLFFVVKVLYTKFMFVLLNLNAWKKKKIISRTNAVFQMQFCKFLEYKVLVNSEMRWNLIEKCFLEI